MRIGKKHHFRLVSTVLVLVLSLLGFIPELAHAATYVGYTSTQAGALTCNTFGNCVKCTQDGTAGVKCGTGSGIQSPLTGTLTSVTLFTGSSVPNQVEIATFSAGTTPASTTVACGYSGQTYNCQQVTDGQSFTVRDVEGLSGLSTQTLTTVALASPVTVTQNQFIAVQFTNTGATSFGLINQVCSNNAGTSCGSIVATGVWDLCLDFLTASPATNAVVSSTGQANGGCGAGIFTGATFSATGTSGQTVTVTQCYGNCGTPAITLANTNSTHSVNFNQSITLLYEFQSNLNGFLINVTTNVAKNYNNGQGIVEAIYTVPTCPLGQSPFTAQCPGYLASGWNVIGNPGKGRIANGNYQIPIANGQWAAVSISGVFAPLDLNDTNTPLTVFQTQGGGCACPPPATITQAVVYSSSFKMGLWAWIVGNVVTSQPPTTPGLSGCAGLDCILTEVTNSFCTNVTTACQTGSALFWVIILTIISIVTVVMAFSEILPSANIGRMGIGELAILFFVGWVVIFTSFNLLSIYVLLLVFFVVAALSAKTVRGYVGI